MEETRRNEGVVTETSFDRVKESMTKVLGAYQEAKKSGEGMSDVDLYEFPPMMRIVREAEKENLEGALNGEELKKIEDTPEFVALSQNAAGAKAMRRSHIYGVRLAILDELEREGKNVKKLRAEVTKDAKDHADAKE